MNIKSFLIISAIAIASQFKLLAQEGDAQNTSGDDLYSLAIQAYNDQQYIQAYQYIKDYESKNDWIPSLGYWKALTIDKIIIYNNISDQKFIELNEVVQRLIQEAEQKSEKERDLYGDQYRDIILIEEKLNFVLAKLKWKNDSSLQQAIVSFQKQDYGAARQHAETAAKANNGAALLMLGQIAEIGYSAQPQNFTKAMEYYEKAFLAGSYDAAYHIGYLYFHGLGVVKNINLAFDWCKIAATYYYIPAMKELSQMYKNGLGTPKEPDLAKYWWDQATLQPQ